MKGIIINWVTVRKFIEKIRGILFFLYQVTLSKHSYKIRPIFQQQSRINRLKLVENIILRPIW